MALFSDELFNVFEEPSSPKAKKRKKDDVKAKETEKTPPEASKKLKLDPDLSTGDSKTQAQAGTSSGAAEKMEDEEAGLDEEMYAC